MRKKSKFNILFKNDKFVLVFSLVLALIIWCVVVITVSPQTTKVITDVNVVIDETTLGYQPFGEVEFVVDVTVVGKKYQISGDQVSKDDIRVVAVTEDVNRAGTYSLKLKAEAIDDNSVFTIASVSRETISVYFDKVKTIDRAIEPELITNGSPIAAEGFTYKEVNLSESLVTITGPALEIDRIDKVVAKCNINEPLVSNLSENVQIVPVDKNGSSDFKYLEYNHRDVVLSIPLFERKTLSTAVYFKNTPDDYIINNPLSYTISPNKAEFDIPVDDNSMKEYYVGTVDFRKLSPSNDSFTFYVDDSDTPKDKDNSFVVTFDLTGYSQEYFSCSKDDVVINNPNNLDCVVSKIPNIAIVGKEESIANITEDMISVEVDLSGLELMPGETKEVPATVMVNSLDCWVYGTYMVKVSA